MTLTPAGCPERTRLRRGTAFAAPPSPLPEVFSTRLSPSGRLLAAVMEGPAPANAAGATPEIEPRVLHIWEGSVLRHAIDLTPHAAGVFADGVYSERLRRTHGTGLTATQAVMHCARA